jgi:hypothetical protein
MLDLAALLAHVEGFEWDAGNTEKNVLGHGVSQGEAEEMFFVAPLVLLEDEKHSASERRFLIWLFRVCSGCAQLTRGSRSRPPQWK